MSDASLPRSFVVTVRSAPARVVVEDVRDGRHAAADDLVAAGAQIERWLTTRADGGPEEGREPWEPGA